MDTNAIADRLHEEFLNVAVCHCGNDLRHGGCDNHDSVWMPCPVSQLLSDAEHAIRSTAARIAAAEKVVEAARKVKDRLDPDMHERDIRSCRDDLHRALAAYPPTPQTEVKG